MFAVLDQEFDNQPALTIKDFADEHHPWLTVEEVREDLFSMLYPDYVIN